MIKIIFQKNGYALANKIGNAGVKTWYCLDLTMSDMDDDSSYDVLYSGDYEGACELYHTIKNG